MHNQYTAQDIERFWGKVDKENSQIFYNGTRCWEWTGACHPKGYGQIRINRETHGSHRVAYELDFGEIPEGLHVLHHCDNPPCVNQSHLFLGTQRDNVDDMNHKGRHADFRGEANPRKKLSTEQVAEIRRRYGYNGVDGESTLVLAEKFGVSPGVLWRIVNNKSWK